MELFLVRHGESKPGIPDPDRNLSEVGIQQVKSFSKAYSSVISGVDAIYCSPYKRAKQTASLIIDGLASKNGHEINWNDDLMPSGNVLSLIAFLGNEAKQRILFVSHMPILGSLVDYLTGEERTFFNTASVASLSMDYPERSMASLNWINNVT